MKPKLIDYSLFKKKVIEEVKIIPESKPKLTTINNKNNFSFLLNIIIILIIFIGSYLLYQRFLQKADTKRNYNNNIKNLYNTINKI